MRILLALLPPLLLTLAACSSRPPAQAADNNLPIDGLSRNISQTPAGAVRDPTSLSPPPVRRDYASDQ